MSQPLFSGSINVQLLVTFPENNRPNQSARTSTKVGFKYFELLTILCCNYSSSGFSNVLLLVIIEQIYLPFFKYFSNQI